MWANLGQIKEVYSNEVYDIIMIVIILWLWNMKWWVSELKRGERSRPPGSAPAHTLLCGTPY